MDDITKLTQVCKGIGGEIQETDLQIGCLYEHKYPGNPATVSLFKKVPKRAEIEILGPSAEKGARIIFDFEEMESVFGDDITFRGKRWWLRFYKGSLTGNLTK